MIIPGSFSARSVKLGMLFPQIILYDGANRQRYNRRWKGNVKVEKTVHQVERPWLRAVDICR